MNPKNNEWDEVDLCIARSREQLYMLAMFRPRRAEAEPALSPTLQTPSATVFSESGQNRLVLSGGPKLPHRT
jgi:hypothetical protein